MGYRCGIGPGMQALGIGTREPHIVCDGCGATRILMNPRSRNMMPPKWFLANRAAPGWRMLRMYDGTKHWELCPKCWKAPDQRGGGGSTP